MITSAFDQLKGLSDDQLQGLAEAARKGDMTAVNALNLTSATPVLAEMMRRQQMRDMFQKNMMANQPDSQKQPSVADQILAANDSGIGGLEVPGVMDEDSESYASGGIVAFTKGGSAGSAGFIETPPGAEYEGEEDLSIEKRLALNPAQERAFELAALNRRFERRREEMGEAPSELSPEEARQLREDYLKQARAITDPYNKRLQELIARTRPDVAGETKKTRDQAEIAAFLSMIGRTKSAGSGFGGSLYNTAQSVLGGVEQYNKGIAELKRAEQKHAEAEMEGIKAESLREAGNLKDALRHEEIQRQARKDALRAYNQGIRDLRGREESERESIDRASIARLRDERAAAQIEARERQAEADRKSREKREAERNKARGGDGRPRGMTEGQFVSNVSKMMTAIKGESGTMKDLRDIHGRGTPALEDAIRNMAIARVNKMRPGAAGKDTPELDKGGASSSQRDAVARIGADGILTPIR